MIQYLLDLAALVLKPLQHLGSSTLWRLCNRRCAERFAARARTFQIAQRKGSAAYLVGNLECNATKPRAFMVCLEEFPRIALRCHPLLHHLRKRRRVGDISIDALRNSAAEPRSGVIPHYFPGTSWEVCRSRARKILTSRCSSCVSSSS